MVLVFISHYHFKVPKTRRKKNTTHHFIMKLPNKRQLQEKASNHSSDIEFKDFIKIFKDYTKKPFSFLVKIQLYHEIIH